MKNYRSEGGRSEGGAPRFGGRSDRNSFSDRSDRSDRGGRGGFGGGRGGFGGGRNSDGPRTMHRATCAECGSACEVPFKPTGEKPVFCSNCFGKRSESRGGDINLNHEISMPKNAKNKLSDKAAAAGEEMEEKLLDINSKLDKLLVILELYNDGLKSLVSLDADPDLMPVQKKAVKKADKKVEKKNPSVKKVAKKKTTKK